MIFQIDFLNLHYIPLPWNAVNQMRDCTQQFYGTLKCDLLLQMNRTLNDDNKSDKTRVSSPDLPPNFTAYNTIYLYIYSLRLIVLHNKHLNKQIQAPPLERHRIQFYHPQSSQLIQLVVWMSSAFRADSHIYNNSSIEVYIYLAHIYMYIYLSNKFSPQRHTLHANRWIVKWTTNSRYMRATLLVHQLNRIKTEHIYILISLNFRLKRSLGQAATVYTTTKSIHIFVFTQKNLLIHWHLRPKVVAYLSRCFVASRAVRLLCTIYTHACRFTMAFDVIRGAKWWVCATDYMRHGCTTRI